MSVNFSFTGPGSTIADGVFIGDTGTETLTIVGDLTLGACAGTVFDNIIVSSNADIIVNGTIGANFSSGAIVSAVDITVTGAITGNFATASSDIDCTGDITIGDCADFCDTSAVDAVNITMGAVSGSICEDGTVTTTTLYVSSFAIISTFTLVPATSVICTNFLSGIACNTSTITNDLTNATLAANVATFAVDPTKVKSGYLNGTLVVSSNNNGVLNVG